MADWQDHDPKPDLNRRNFLKTVTGGAAGAVAGAAPASARGGGLDRQTVPSDPALRTKALESLLVEKGYVDSATLDAFVDTYEHKVGPHNGARVVARAWLDPAFRRRLLED